MTIRTRDIDTALTMLYVQYGVHYRVVSSREVDGWTEIVVEQIGVNDGQ